MAEEQPRKGGLRWYEIVFFAVVVLLIGINLYGRKSQKIGVVDVQQVAKACGIDARMNENMRQWEQEARRQLAELQEEVQTKAAEVEAQLSSAADDAERERIQAEIQALRRESSQRNTGIRNDLRRRRADELAAIETQIRALVSDVAGRRNYDIVLAASQGVLLAAPTADLTEEVARLAQDRIGGSVSQEGLPELESLKAPAEDAASPAAAEGEPQPPAE